MNGAEDVADLVGSHGPLVQNDGRGTGGRVPLSRLRRVDRRRAAERTDPGDTDFGAAPSSAVLKISTRKACGDLRSSCARSQ